MNRTTLLAIVVLATSCSSTSSGSTTTPGLRSADSIRANEAVGGTPATFGTIATLAGVAITASDPVANSDESGPWLTVTVHAENPTDGDLPSPFFAVHCAGVPDGGGFLASSTFSSDGLPAKSFDDGHVDLLLPGDGRFGEPRPTCSTPAVLVAVPSNGGVTFDGQPSDSLAWPIPDAVIDELNAAPQPTTATT